MIIKELRCSQFAGIIDRTIKFKKGLNIVVGPNESGKSTLIDLIYHMFFKDVILDGRTDKEFKDTYFPKNTGAYQGDTIDGSLIFETNNGEYRLMKEWSGRKGVCALTMPDGAVIKDGSVIKTILAEELGYGRGIYDELIFKSQKRGQGALKRILDGGPSAAADELSSLLTKAVMETGGIDIEKMGGRLDAIISQYTGHWDFEADMPEGGRKRMITNPWKRDVGSILAAYYEMEAIADMRENAEAAERNVERINSEIRNRKLNRQELDNERREFAKVRNLLSERNNLKALIESDKRELTAMEEALAAWPDAENAIKQAKELQIKLEQTRAKALYDEVRLIVRQLENNQTALKELGAVKAEDIKEAERLQREIERLELKLGGINISAKISPVGNTQVSVVSETSGQALDGSGGVYNIDEAVNITVPGVVAVQLMPKGVNISDIKEEIKLKANKIKELCDLYGAGSVDEMKKKYDERIRLTQENILYENRVSDRLGNASWETLEREAMSLPRLLPPIKTVESEIKQLCGRASLEGFIGAKEEKVSGYISKYENGERLSLLVKEKKACLEKNIARLDRANEIPERFSAVDDPDAHEEELSKRIENTDSEIERLRSELSAAEKSLGDRSAEEYSEEYLLKRSVFMEQKAKCKRWMHIREVFSALRNDMKGNPMEDVEKYFAENLSALSGGDIMVGKIGENLETEIISKNHRLTYQILSAGTKDTLSLGFRLAVLGHLYPDGGCVAVFDDPFTDMDPVRTAGACAMIQKFAEKNQVLFITCDDKYCDFMDGSIVRVS